MSVNIAKIEFHFNQMCHERLHRWFWENAIFDFVTAICDFLFPFSTITIVCVCNALRIHVLFYFYKQTTKCISFLPHAMYLSSTLYFIIICL